jgi:hypothetical protein
MATVDNNAARILSAGEIATGCLAVFGFGCWLWRANQWMRKSE